MISSFSNHQLDFVYWHAVSKMRISLFKDAAILFRLIAAVDPQRKDALLGRIYCMVREGELQDANDLLTQVDIKSLGPIEAELIVRLKRRCDFELNPAQQAKTA